MDVISSPNNTGFNPEDAQTQIFSRPVKERLNKETMMLSAPKAASTVKIKLPNKLSIEVQVVPNCCLVIGRAPEAPENKTQYTLLALDSVQVSRTHLAVFQEKGHLYVQDMGATNGSYIMNNGTSEALTPYTPVLMSKTSAVEFGEAVLTVQSM